MTNATQAILIGIYALSLLVIIFVIGERQEGAPVLNAIRAIFGYKPVQSGGDSLLRYPSGDDNGNPKCPAHGDKTWTVCWHCDDEDQECEVCKGEAGWWECLVCHPERRQGPQPFDVEPT